MDGRDRKPFVKGSQEGKCTSVTERVKDRLDRVARCRADTGSPLLNVTVCHCLQEA